jgi:hypothetical protein
MSPCFFETEGASLGQEAGTQRPAAARAQLLPTDPPPTTPKTQQFLTASVPRLSSRERCNPSNSLIHLAL